MIRVRLSRKPLSRKPLGREVPLRPELVTVEVGLVLGVRAGDEALLLLACEVLPSLARAVRADAEPDGADYEEDPPIVGQESETEQHQNGGEDRMAAGPGASRHDVSDVGRLMNIDGSVVRAVVELVAHGGLFSQAMVK